MDDDRQRRSEYCKPFRKPTNEVVTKKEKHPLDLMIAFYIIKMDKKLVINFSRASPADLLDV
jgi:hypothetical protein